MAKKIWFDPQKRIEMLNDPVGGYQWSLESDFNEKHKLGALADNASSDLTIAIYCLLVNYDEPARQLLEKARDWVQIAIEEEERPQRYFPEGTEASRYETLAMCHWILQGKTDLDSLKKFVEHKDRYINTNSLHKDKITISLTLPSFVDAGDYERTIELFEATPKRKAPESPGKIRNEAQMCYVLAHNQLGTGWDKEVTNKALMKFLDRSVDHWLDNGHAKRAAE